MKHAQELVDALKNITAVDGPVFTGIVKAVDKTNNVCDIEYHGVELGDVRLQAIIKPDTKGLLLYPAIDSIVVTQRLGRGGDMFITLFSEIEEVMLQVGDSTLNVKDGFLIQRNDETLKSIISDLIDEIKLITVPTNFGPSGVPFNATALEAIKTRSEQLLK